MKFIFNPFTGKLDQVISTASEIVLGNVENTAHSTDAHTMAIDGRDVSADGSKLDGIAAGADVTGAANVNAAGAVMESDFSTYQIVTRGGAAVTCITVPEQTVIGRQTSGNIAGLTAAQINEIIGVYAEYNPSITCSSQGGYNLDADYNTLAYYRLGRLVHIQGWLRITSESGTPIGTLKISLPGDITPLGVWGSEGSGNLRIPGVVIVNHGDAAIENPLVYPYSTYMGMYNILDNGTIEELQHDDVDTAFDIYLSVSFITI